MAILVKCQSCTKKFRAKDEKRGQKIACPNCGKPLLLQGKSIPDYEVFISYSSHDKPTADAVCRALEDSKLRCWIAPRNIKAGRNWGGAIIEAIEQSRMVVLIFSRNSNTSGHVLREIERAVAKRLDIVPFRIDEIVMSKDLEFFLSTRQWLDAVSNSMEANLDQLVKCVRETITGGSDGKPGTVPRQKTSTARIGEPRWWVQEAQNLATTLTDMNERQSAARNLAEVFAKVGFFEQAKELGAQLTEPNSRNRVFEKIVKMQAQSGDIAGATATALGLGDAVHVAVGLKDIAAVQAGAGDINGAISTAGMIQTVPLMAANAWTSIGAAQVKALDFSGAMRSLSMAPDSLNRSDVLLDMIKHHAETGDYTAAIGVIGQMEGDTASQIQAHLDLGKSQAFNRDLAAACESFNRAKRLAASMVEPGPKIHLFHQIILAQAESEDISGALDTLQRIPLTHIDSSSRQVGNSVVASLAVNGAERRADALASIAEAQSRTGDRRGAEASLASAQAIVNGIAFADLKIDCWLRLARSHANLGDCDGARNTMQSVKGLIVALQAGNPQLAASKCEELVRTQLKSGDRAGAQSTATAFAPILGSSSVAGLWISGTRLEHVYCEIAEAIARQKQFVELKKWCDTIKHPHSRMCAIIGAVHGLLPASLKKI